MFQVYSNTYSTIRVLAFVLAKFSLLRLNEKERNFPYVFVKKAEDK